MIVKIWLLALASAAGLGLGTEEAFAERPRHGHSAARQNGQHQSRAHSAQPNRQQHTQSNRQQHTQSNGQRHGQPHWQHHGQSHHNHHFFSHRPARIVVVPSFAPRHYIYVPAPVVVQVPVAVAPPVIYPSLNSPYWFYCPDSRAYYPHVLECPSAWLQVVPTN